MANSKPLVLPSGTPWPAGDPLIAKYSIATLQAAGYLNIDKPSITEKIKPHDKETWPSYINPYPNAIHPMLRRERWHGVTDADFALLEPALLLTSCFLGEPCVMPFFAGLEQENLKPLDDPKARALFNNQELYWFDLHPDKASSSGYIPLNLEAWKFLAKDMASKITFTMGGNDSGTHASTHVQSHIPGRVPGKTFGSEIRLDNQYLHVFQNKFPVEMPYVDVFPPNMPDKDKIQLESAKMRAAVHMATAILHELAHAVVFATVSQSKTIYMPTELRQPEPFFRKGRIQEVGLAFQQYLFDGVLLPNVGKVFPFCLYGLHMRDFPGAYHLPPKGGKVYELQTPRDVGHEVEWRYAVHMDWIRKFMTTAFWEREALRSEPNSAFKYQRTEYRAFTTVAYASEAASTTTPAVPKITPAATKTTPTATKTTPAATKITPATTKPTKTPPPGPPTTTGPSAPSGPSAPVVESGTEGGWTEVSSKRKNKDNAGRGGKKSRG